MIKFRVEVKDIWGDRGEVSVRTADTISINSFLQESIDTVANLSDGQISDFDVTQELDLDLPAGLKDNYIEDAHPRSNALVTFESQEGVKTRLKIPMNSLPNDTEQFLDDIPNVVTNLKNDALTAISVVWSN